MQKKLKSILCLLLCLILAAALPMAAMANIIGDITGDGIVKPEDARFALRAAIGLEKYAPGSAEFKAADADFDNKITTNDARSILRAAIGLEKLKEANHEHTWKAEKAGTNAGYHNLVCTECGEKKQEKCTYSDKWLPYPGTTLTEPTCTKDANVYTVCTVCEGKYAKTLEKLNHAGKKRIAALSVDATCTTAGYDFYECPLCGQNGNTLKDLKVAVPAYGHAPSSAADPINSDIVCERCNKTITPAFNTLVNAINMKAVPTIYFSGLTKTDSSGELKKDANGNEMYNIHIPDAAKTLMRLAGESMDEQKILDEFTKELNSTDSTYSSYYWNSPFLTLYYPIQDSETVSALTKNDVTDINIQEMDRVDFMDEINAMPDTIKLQVTGGTRNLDLTKLKAMGNGMSGNIYKITVVLKEEKYSKLKNSTEETALQHALGVDIRTYPEMFTQDDSEDGFDLKMTCNEVVSNCTITYYFLVEGEGTDTTYKPLGSRYVTSYVIDQHIDLRAGMPISELGIDSGILNAFLALTGMKQGDDLVFMEGTIDLLVKNTNTDYFLFTTTPTYD